MIEKNAKPDRVSNVIAPVSTDPYARKIDFKAPFSPREEIQAYGQLKKKARSNEDHQRASWALILWRRKIIGHYKRRPAWKRHWLSFPELASYFADCGDGTERRRLQGFQSLINAAINGSFSENGRVRALLITDGWYEIPCLPEGHSACERLDGDVLKAIRRAGYRNDYSVPAGEIRRPVVDEELVKDVLQFLWVKRSVCERWLDEVGLAWNTAWGGKSGTGTTSVKAWRASSHANVGRHESMPAKRRGRPKGSCSLPWQEIDQIAARCFQYHGPLQADDPEWSQQSHLIAEVQQVCSDKGLKEPSLSQLKIRAKKWTKDYEAQEATKLKK